MTALDRVHPKAPSSLNLREAPNPVHGRGAPMALLSPAQGHTTLLVSAVWTVPGGHWASRGPCFAICTCQKIMQRGRGQRELGDVCWLQTPRSLCLLGPPAQLTNMLPLGCLSLRGLLLAVHPLVSLRGLRKGPLGTGPSRPSSGCGLWRRRRVGGGHPPLSKTC